MEKDGEAVKDRMPPHVQLNAAFISKFLSLSLYVVAQRDIAASGLKSLMWILLAGYDKYLSES